MPPANRNPPPPAVLPPLMPVTSRGEATRRKLLAAAEVELGDKGFHAASVSSITQRADVGQGTFYLYFHTKEEVFATLVRDLARDLRHVLSVAVAEATSVAEAERALLQALMTHMTTQAGRHRILKEAQFVDEPVFRESQDKLLTAVSSALSILARGQLGKSAAEVRAAVLVGAAEQVALRHGVWARKAVTPALLDEMSRSLAVA